MWLGLLRTHHYQHTTLVFRSHFGCRGLDCDAICALRQMATHNSGNIGPDDLPDELPLSQGTEGSASVLEANGHNPASNTPAEQQVPDEWPWPSGESDIFGDFGGQEQQAVVPDPSPATDAGPETPSGVSLDPTQPAANTDFAPNRKRRGRPNVALQEALRLAAERLGEAPADDSEVAIVRGPVAEVGARMAVAQHRAELLRKCSLGEQDRACLLKRPINGICSASPAAGVLVASHGMSKLPGQQPLDGDILTAAETFLGDATLPLASKKFRAESMGIPYQKVDAIVPLFSSAAMLLDRHNRAQVERNLAEGLPPAQLLYYVDGVAYDETPMPVAIKDVLEVQVASSGGSARELGDTSSSQALCTLAPGSVLAGKLVTTQGPQKILQTLQTGGLLIELASGCVVTILTPTLCNLTAMAAGSGACIAEAQLRLSGVTRAAGKFTHATRSACTDRNGANLLAERQIAKERSEPWDSLHVLCGVHKTAGAHEKTFALVDEGIRGMIHCALALRNGSAMSRFRRCMKEEIESRFKLMHGEATLDAQRHRQRVLDLFVSHGSQVAIKRLLLCLCPNGDWRHAAVEYYPPAGQPQRTEAEYCGHLAAGLLAALCSSQPSTYPRSRWTGADLATDSLGIVEACHRLLSTSFLRFAAFFEHDSRSRRLLAASAASLEGEGQGAGAADEEVRPVADDEDGPTMGDAQSADASAIDQPLPTAPGPTATWAEINAAHRRIAAEWLLKAPLPTLMLQRLVMEPLRQLMASQFRVASQDWELEQRHRVAQGAATCGPSLCRKYRLSVAAAGEDEARAFAKFDALFREPTFWAIFDLKAHTVEFRALAFRMIAKAGCSVRQLLDFANKSFPIRLFLLLAEPGLAAELAAVPECLLDGWSLRMKQLHPGFAGQRLLQKLALIATITPKDISQVEARHATVRRFFKGASLQTHPQRLEELSSQWVLMQYRRRRLCGKPFRKAMPRKVS